MRSLSTFIFKNF